MYAAQSVYKHIQQEYGRTCLIAYESQPKDCIQEGWGAPGTYKHVDPMPTLHVIP